MATPSKPSDQIGVHPSAPFLYRCAEKLKMTYYQIFREALDIVYYLSAPVIAVFAWRALKQIQVAAEQVTATREIAKICAQREALRISAEQTVDFAETFVPIWNDFFRLRAEGKYPILSASKVEESWPNVQCHFDDLPGMLKEVFSNDAVVVRAVNRMEGFAMYFACGVADGDKAYRPVASMFCEAARAFLPYMIYANERENQFTYSLHLYSTWGIRRFTEDTNKEIAKKSDLISKIRIPEVRPIGT